MHFFIKKIVVLFLPLLLLQVAQAQNRFQAFTYNDQVSYAPKAVGDPERRYLDINQELLNKNNISSGDIITIQYEGREFDFRVKKLASYMQDTYTIVATSGDRYLYFTVNNDKVIASIQIPEIRYQGVISHDPDLQMNYLYEHDHSMELSCGLDLFRVEIQGQIDSHMKSRRVNNASDVVKKMQGQNAQTTITLLIVYANGAGTWMAANGGINNVINQSMTMSQEAMDVSGTEITFDLVHSASVNYNEAGVSSNDILRFLRVKNDGIMDEVHTLRDTHLADVVALFVDEGDTGGLGYLINQPTGDPDFAFNLNRVQQITDTYTLVHEIAHNMGSDHSRNQSASPADANGGVFPYSTGWRWIGTNGISYSSVMTYASFPIDGVMSTRTPHFSNPNINFQGTPTGTSSGAVQYGPADNARSLREMKDVTAAYRQSTAQETPVITTTPITNITTTSATAGGNVTSQGGSAVTARGVCYATTQNPTTAGQCIASGNGTGAFTANLTGLTLGTLYNVRAYATNTAGTSYGAQVSFTTNQSTIQLCEALDNCNLTFMTGGAASWIGQTQVSQDGVDAAQSGLITHNQESSLTTTVNGSGTLSFYWKVSSEPEFDFLELRIDGALDRRVSGEFDWARVELNLPGPTHTVQWRYIKDESENAGLDRAWVDQVGFLANQTAPTVTTEAVTAIGTTTATGGGNVTSQGSSAVTARGVCYATTQNPTTANTCVASGNGTGAFTANLTGLALGTLYNVRAYATNTAGTSYGDQVSFTTATPAVAPTVTTAPIINIGTIAATGGGNVADGGSTAVTARGVCYATTQNPTTADQCVASGNGTGAFTASLTGLTPSTLYNVRAYATNAAGTSYGAQVSFTTQNPFVNKQPTMNVIGDVSFLHTAAEQVVNLSGISAGDGENQNVTVTAVAANSQLIQSLSVQYESPQATGTLRFQNDRRQVGTTTISVKVKDDAGTANGGVDSLVVSFVVNVLLDTDLGDDDTTPKEFRLDQNYPNPFNPSTQISFSMPTREMVRLTIYDMMGRQRLLLLNSEMAAGTHSVTVDASSLSSGIYMYVLSSGNFTAAKKMTLIK